MSLQSREPEDCGFFVTDSSDGTGEYTAYQVGTNIQAARSGASAKEKTLAPPERGLLSSCCSWSFESPVSWARALQNLEHLLQPIRSASLEPRTGLPEIQLLGLQGPVGHRLAALLTDF